jgi:uncharacterized protein YecE (DUF72 family)
MAEARIFLGTCAFTASGWSGAFYPKGMKSAEYLSFYSERFDTVEIDSTFYGCPRTDEKSLQARRPSCSELLTHISPRGI